jgi:hypothetical protein
MNELKELMTAKDYERYEKLVLKRTLENQKDISYCPTADCRNGFIYDPERDGKEFKCEFCKKHYCL